MQYNEKYKHRLSNEWRNKIKFIEMSLIWP